MDAAYKSLTSFDGPVVAILGGRYKGGDLGRLQEAAQGRVKAVMAIGEASARVREALSPVAPVTSCDSLGQAVGDALLRQVERLELENKTWERSVEFNEVAPGLDYMPAPIAPSAPKAPIGYGKGVDGARR